MTLSQILAASRDAFALVVAASAALTAAAFYSGVVGWSGGLAASVATIAVSGLAAFGVFGATAALGAPSLLAMGLTATGLGLIGAVVGALQFGVRGLWVALLAVVGAALAWALLAIFARAFDGRIALQAPLIAFTVLALLCLGALSAAARLNGPPTAPVALAGSDPASPPPLARGARALFAEPPAWFDCLYTRFGGVGLKPGLCAETPPDAATSPAWASAPTPAPQRDAALADMPGSVMAASGSPQTDIVDPVAQAALIAPETLTSPSEPSVETPVFDTGQPPDGAPTEAPQQTAPSGTLDIETATLSGASDPTPTPPTPSAAPSPLEAAPAPDPAADVARTPQDAVRAMTAQTPPPTERRDGDPEVDTSGGDARMRTEFVCFPMLSVAPDRLCPDERFDADDIEARWRPPGGDAFGVAEQVSCYFAPERALHVTLLVALSGDLVATDPSAAGPKRRIDLVYDVLTKFWGASRAAALADGDRAKTYFSVRFIGGSRLLSPWATLEFGEGRVDRLFDVAAGGHVLTLVGRLRTERDGLRPGGGGRSVDALAALQSALDDRPPTPGPGAQSVILVVTGPDAGVGPQSGASGDEGDALAARFAAAQTPVFWVALGVDAPSDSATRLAEASGGAAYGVRSVDAFWRVLEETTRRAWSYCAVRVSGPAAFFESGALELRLNRRLRDGCRLTQVAVQSCEGLSVETRIDLDAE